MTTGPKVASRRKRRTPCSEYIAYADDNPLGLAELSEPLPRQPWRWIGLFAFVLISMSMLATLAVVTIARDKKMSLLQAEENRLQESVSGRATILETWLDGQRSVGRRLTNSHVFRLFVTDLSAQDLRLPLPRSILDQRPYFQQLIADFAHQNDLVRATVLRADGAILLSSPGPKLNTASLLSKATELNGGRSILFSPIRSVDQEQSEIVIDALIGIPEAQQAGHIEETPPAYLVLTLNAIPIIQTTLARKLSTPENEEIVLFQRRGEWLDKFRTTSSGVEMAAVALLDDIEPGMPISFARREYDAPVYSIGEGVDGVPLTLYHALDAKVALGPLNRFVGLAATLFALATLLLAIVFSSLWWRQDRDYHVGLVEAYKDHGEKVDRQRQFLQAVMQSIGDWLAVTTPDGKIIYANPSFNAAIGQSKFPTNSRIWNDLVNIHPSKPLYSHNIEHLIDGSSFETIQIENKKYTVSMKASDLHGDDGELEGKVYIVRDHSEIIKERQRRLGSLSQTVNAFIRAVERRDPFLLGHTKRVRTHALAVGLQLKLSQDDLATLALAASLSQIGKIFIPEDLLTKPDRHDTAEEDIMREHILHAIEILEPIDFELPVAETLAQMHERLDGSGYPYGLSGERIGTMARILGVADVFCARTAPRSYREQVSAGKALFHLASNVQRYDLKVVSALADIVGKSQEVSDFEIINETFIDSEIWQNHYEAGAVGQPASAFETS